MLQFSRINAFLEYIREEKSATYRKLSADLHYSESTIRRDALILEKQGYITSVYGGVILNEDNINTTPLPTRVNRNIEAKINIAKQAASKVQNGMSLLLYSSSTVIQMIPFLKPYKKLKVLTNSLTVLEKLTEIDADVYLTGGRLRRDDGILIGSFSENTLSSFHPDLAFYSPSAISFSGDVTTHHDDNLSFIRTMLKRSEKFMLLCDSSKIGQSEMFSICSVEDVDAVFCETEIPSSINNLIGMNRKYKDFFQRDEL